MLRFNACKVNFIHFSVISITVTPCHSGDVVRKTTFLTILIITFFNRIKSIVTIFVAIIFKGVSEVVPIGISEGIFIGVSKLISIGISVAVSQAKIIANDHPDPGYIGGDSSKNRLTAANIRFYCPI